MASDENSFDKSISNPTKERIPVEERCFRETTDDYPALLKFIFRSHKKVDFFDRIRIVRKFNKITRMVDCPHTQDQILQFIISVMSLPPTMEGCIVEAGTYKGGAAAKFSIIAKLLGRRLIIFDSFEGLPQNEEKHEKSILGHSVMEWFKGGNFRGTLDEVRRTIETYGAIKVCTFQQGWFEETMPGFKEKICALYIDCDLAASTKTTLKYLYPLSLAVSCSLRMVISLW